MTAVAAIGAPRAAPGPALQPAAAAGTRWPARGIAVLFALALAALPLLRPAGPGNTSPVDLTVVVAVAGLLWTAHRRGISLRAPYFYSWAVLILAGCLATVAGAHTLQSEQAIGFPVAAAIGVLQDVYLLAWTFAVCNVCREAGVLGLLLPAWALSAAAWAGLMTVGVVLNVQALSGIEPGNGVRAELTFGDPNMASNYYVMALMVLWASRRPRRWPLRAAAGLLLLAGMAFTGSNGAVVNLGVSAGVCLILLAGRRWGVPAAVACALVLGLAVATEVTLLPPQTIQLAARQSGQPILRDWIGRSDQSAAQRLVLVDEASTLYGEGGLLGLGPGSTKPILALTQANYVHAAHDDYVASLVERGLLGALGLVLLIGAIAVRSAQVLRRPLRSSFAAVVDPVPLVAALAGLACAATFYQVLHFRHVWALLGILAAIHIWGVRRLEPV